MDVRLDVETLRLIKVSKDPNEIVQLCLKAGIAAGDLAADSLGNIILNIKTLPPISRPIFDFDNRDDVSNANPRPENLEFMK